MKILLLSILLFSTSLFANYVATITAIKGSASIQRDGKSTPVLLGTQLNPKDTVITKENTKVQIIFTDETIISIGKNSEFSIEEFIFEEDQEPIAKFGMLKGAMRTITGKIGDIAPDKFTVTTKTATIGIRGTNFTIIALEDMYRAYCTYGEISANINGEEFFIRQGYFIDVLANMGVSIEEFTPASLQLMKNQNFTVASKKKGTVNKNSFAATSAKQNTSQLNVTTSDFTPTNSDTFSEPAVTSVQNTTAVEKVLEDSKEEETTPTPTTPTPTTPIPTTPTIPDITGITENSVIAALSSTAIYQGTYTTTTNTIVGLGDSGYSAAIINFGNDTAYLGMGPSTNANPVIQFYFTNVNTNTITGNRVDSTTFNTHTNILPGSAAGVFSGATGSTLSGTFTALPTGTTGQSIGSYNITKSY